MSSSSRHHHHDQRLFFIYVAHNKDWQRLQAEDWGYVFSMTRFFHWWAKRFFGVDFAVEADILPVIPNRLFDRMSIAYLSRDHTERGEDTFHFYLAYFKPLWTDCRTEGYFGEGFAMAYWQRPEAVAGGEDAAATTAEMKRLDMFARENCPRVSHVLAHQALRASGRTKKDYFGKVHELWEKHRYKDLPYLYFDSQFHRVSGEGGSYRFVTIDPTEL